MVQPCFSLWGLDNLSSVQAYVLRALIAALHLDGVLQYIMEVGLLLHAWRAATAQLSANGQLNGSTASLTGASSSFAEESKRGGNSLEPPRRSISHRGSDGRAAGHNAAPGAPAAAFSVGPSSAAAAAAPGDEPPVLVDEGILASRRVGRPQPHRAPLHTLP